MTLTLDPADFGVWPYHMRASKHDRPWNYIFCSDELPTFCRILLELAIANDFILRNTAIYIGINAAIWNGQAAGIDSNLAGLARMRKLLEPLRQLHSFGAAQVEGPLSGSYKGSINASVCKECPTAFDIIETAMEALSQGDEQVSKGRLRQSNQGYKAALNYVRSCFWRYDERDFIMNSGPFPKLEAIQVMANLQVRLQARIASVYLESGKLRMARIYTERALDPRRRYDHRQHKLYYSLDLQPWQKVVYAEVLHVAAKVRYIQGHAGEAEQRLSEAGELVPLNEEQQSRYEAWQTRAVILYDRQTKSMQAKRLLSEKQDEMAEGIS